MTLEPKVVGIVNTDEAKVNFEFVDLDNKVIKIYKDHEEFEDVLDPESTCHADPTGGGDPFADGRGHG